MPELPEAETIVRTLRPWVAGRRILEARFLAARVSNDDPSRLAGRLVRNLRRYGKQILWELDAGFLVVRLGMTGALLVDREPGPHTRAQLLLEGVQVLFDDVRQFGSVRWTAAPPAELGPDPLEIPLAEFVRRLRQRDTGLKRLLLDQAFVRGLGNIYADEALFRAGVHPLARTRRLSMARVAALHKGMVELLEEAIDCRGSSISDYVDALGQPGVFQLRHRVYGRFGEPCVLCGGRLGRMLVAQRGTCFCPRCQKR